MQSNKTELWRNRKSNQLNKDIESVIKILLIMKNIDTDAFKDKFYHLFKELMSILLKIFENI